MKKADTDKARMRVIGKIKRELRKGTKVRKIADSTGYTTARIYQIRGDMRDAGEIK